MTLHLQKRLNLTDGEILPIPKRDQLIEGAEEIEGMFEDLALVQALANAANYLGEEVERVNVLEDVRLFVRNEHHVKLIKGLVDESDIVLLDCRVLCPRVCCLGEGGQKSFYARPLDIMECSG